MIYRQSLKDYQDCLDNLKIKRDNLSIFDISKKIDLSFEIKAMNNGLDDVYINSYEFNQLEDVYREFISRIGDFFRNNGIVDVIEILSVYSYFIKNGYLSYDKKFVYKKTLDDCIYMLGSNVVSGFGVCRHITSMLTDIYKELGYDSYNISMIFEKSKSFSKQSFLAIKERKKICECIKKYIYILLCGGYYNHLVTLVNNDSGSLIVDPTNDIISYVNFAKRIFSVKDRCQCFDCSFMSVFNNEEEIAFDSILNVTDLSVLDRIGNNYNNGWNKISNNNYLADNFYEKNVNLCKEIDSKRRVLSYEFNRYLG